MRKRNSKENTWQSAYYAFVVAEIADIAPTDIEAIAETDYPLTIFTCTPGGQNRYVVYCDMG